MGLGPGTSEAGMGGDAAEGAGTAEGAEGAEGRRQTGAKTNEKLFVDPCIRLTRKSTVVLVFLLCKGGLHYTNQAKL